MNEFWFWFVRPMAEVLGIVALAVFIGMMIEVWEWWEQRRKK